jgi:NAD(P)-dependent dehydrogenase (short-subunit alcohol dehydrogenase family)
MVIYRVVNLIQCGAWRLRGKNIRVNAVCPVRLDRNNKRNVYTKAIRRV